MAIDQKKVFSKHKKDEEIKDDGSQSKIFVWDFKTLDSKDSEKPDKAKEIDPKLEAKLTKPVKFKFKDAVATKRKKSFIKKIQGNF